MEKLKTIGLSFKNTYEDRKLHNWIYQHSNISGFIKDILREKMEQEGTEVVKVAKTVKEEKQLLDLSDF